MNEFPPRITPSLLNIDGLIYIISNSYECQDVLNFANLNKHYRGLFEENSELLYREMKKRGMFHRNSPATVDNYRRLVVACRDLYRLNYIDEQIATGIDLTDLLEDHDKLRAALLGLKFYKKYNDLTPTLSTKIIIIDNNTSDVNEKIEKAFLKARLDYVKHNIGPPKFNIGEYDTTIEGYEDLRFQIFQLSRDDYGVFPGDIMFIDSQNRPVAYISFDMEWVYSTEEYETEDGPYEKSENNEKTVEHVLEHIEHTPVDGEIRMVEYIDNVRDRYQNSALDVMIRNNYKNDSMEANYKNQDHIVRI
jgi:hypothetical protein